MATLRAVMFSAMSVLAWHASAGEPSVQKKPESPRTRQACTAKGGTWMYYPMGQFHFCDLRTTDAGKPCSDDKQCQGDCVPAEGGARSPGVCAPALPAPGGCPVHLVNGKVVLEPCI